LYYCSIAKFVRYDDGFVFPIEGLRARHVLVSLHWEADLMAAIAATPGTGHAGGKCKDNVKVRRRVILSIPAGPWEAVEKPELPSSSSFHDAHVFISKLKL
jgi:hypothetical protein